MIYADPDRGRGRQRRAARRRSVLPPGGRRAADRSPGRRRRKGAFQGLLRSVQGHQVRLPSAPRRSGM